MKCWGWSWEWRELSLELEIRSLGAGVGAGESLSCLAFTVLFPSLVWPSSCPSHSPPHVIPQGLVVRPALNCSQLCSPARVFK